GSRDLLAAAGGPFVAARRVTDEQEALEAAEAVGYPVVLKALGLLHKSDAGGVKVGIPDAEALAWEWGDMQQRLVPPECSIEAMAPLAEGVELIVGARRDVRFGPVAMVGVGGVYAELLEDVAVGLAPLDHEAAERLIRSLRGAASQPTDVRDPDQVDAMVAAAAERFGRVDVLINNAAGNFVVRGEDLSPNGWRAVVSIVLDGGFLCTRAAGRQMIAQGDGGSILSVIASYAWTGGPGTVHSAAAKAGLLAMTKTLAVEWPTHGILLDTVVPG